MREQGLTPGTLHVKSKGTDLALTTNPLSEVHAVVKGTNTPEELVDRFYRPDHPDTVARREFDQGGNLRLHRPTGPYADLDIMVVAHAPHSLEITSDGLVAVENIYRYPQEIQEAYWQYMLGTMLGFINKAPSNTRVIMGENCIATYSTDKLHTSRSVANPHAHVLGIDPGHIVPFENGTTIPTKWLAEEQELIQSHGDTLTEKVHTRLPKDLKRKLHLKPRGDAPYGYSFQIQGNIQTMIENPKAFSRLMREHHRALAPVLRAFEGEHKENLLRQGYEQVIPQPSYRLYLESEDGKMFVTVSPEILSHAGILEAAGVLLDRHPSHPRRISPQTIQEIEEEASTIVDSVFADDNQQLVTV